MNSRMRNTVQGYLFISPVVLGLLIFTIGPMLTSFYMSFTKFPCCGRRSGSGCATMS